MIDPKLLERFKSHVAFLDDSDDSCWIWVGALQDDGRGRFRINGKEASAHRVGWELLHGQPIPDGIRLVQECTSPQCVRHWRLDKPYRKLSDLDVSHIRGSSLSLRRLASIFGVNVRHVWSIKHHERRV